MCWSPLDGNLPDEISLSVSFVGALCANIPLYVSVRGDPSAHAFPRPFSVVNVSLSLSVCVCVCVFVCVFQE